MSKEVSMLLVQADMTNGVYEVLHFDCDYTDSYSFMQALKYPFQGVIGAVLQGEAITEVESLYGIKRIKP
jgi:hypothetical protein